MGLEPRPVSVPIETIIVVVAEIVMVVARPKEQVVRKDAHVDDGLRCVVKVRLAIHPLFEIHGREQHTASVKIIVPVAFHKDVAARRPDVMRWHPYPVRPCAHPVPGPPRPVAVAPDPRAGDPEMFLRRGEFVIRNAGLQRLWGFRKVHRLGAFDAVPEAGHPVKAVARLRPVSRDPLPVRRNIAPDSADPDELVADVVPCPVAGNPPHVEAVGAEFRWNFLDGLRRGHGCSHARRGIEQDRLGKCLVHGSARQNVRGGIGAVRGVCRFDLCLSHGTGGNRQNAGERACREAPGTSSSRTFGAAASAAGCECRVSHGSCSRACLPRGLRDWAFHFRGNGI